jgi:hypothetical protein
MCNVRRFELLTAAADVAPDEHKLLRALQCQAVAGFVTQVTPGRPVPLPTTADIVH